MGVDLTALNEYLADKTFIAGFTPSQADVATYDAIGAPAGLPAHVARFHKLVDSYSSYKKSKLPGAYAAKFEVASAAAPAAAAAGGDGEEMDLWGDEPLGDEYTAEEQANQDRLDAIAAAHKEKKRAAGKLKVVIGMSKIVLDVKPWDDETDLEAMEAVVRKITHPTNPKAVEWQASELKEVGYGIKKLSIMVQVIDDEISVDEDIIAVICDGEGADFVQSVDIVAFNKV